MQYRLHPQTLTALAPVRRHGLLRVRSSLPALRALHRGDPSDPLVASNALRIARDPAFPSVSRTTALLILEDCVRSTPSTSSTSLTPSTLTETDSAVSADPAASSLLRRTAEAVLERNAH